MYVYSGVTPTCTGVCTFAYESGSTPVVSSIVTELPNSDYSESQFTFTGSGIINYYTDNLNLQKIELY